LEEDSARRRRTAEQETERSIARREAEASARIQNRDQLSIAGLHLILKIIGLQLAERVSAVERKESQLTELCAQVGRQVGELETTRTKIATQLTTTRQVLAQALEQVDHTEVEHPDLPSPVPIQRGGRAPAEQPSDSTPVQLRVIRADERR